MRCQALGQRQHPVFKDKTIDEVYQEELAQCRPPMAPFDGYSEKILRVSSTCLISYDRNRYSVPSHFAGKLLTLRAYADKLVLISENEHGLDTVNTACELALAQGTGHLSTIVNIVHRLAEPQQLAALNVVNTPRIQAQPVANCQRYDELMREVLDAKPC